MHASPFAETVDYRKYIVLENQTGLAMQLNDQPPLPSTAALTQRKKLEEAKNDAETTDTSLFNHNFVKTPQDPKFNQRQNMIFSQFSCLNEQFPKARDRKAVLAARKLPVETTSYHLT